MRGKHIATALLERVIQDATKEGYDYIESYPNKTESDMYYNFVGLLDYIKNLDLYNLEKQKIVIQFFAAIIILTPYVFATTGIHIGSLENTGIINLLILGIIHTGICYCLYFSSLKDLKGQEASILSYVDPLIAIIASVTILGESILPMQIIGGIMILGFTLLNEIKLKPRRFYGIANKKKNTQL